METISEIAVAEGVQEDDGRRGQPRTLRHHADVPAYASAVAVPGLGCLVQAFNT